jgi:hypothetical protein
MAAYQASECESIRAVGKRPSSPIALKTIGGAIKTAEAREFARQELAKAALGGGPQAER